MCRYTSNSTLALAAALHLGALLPGFTFALRKRIAEGVTSMRSSSATYPMASSNLIAFGGVRRTVSSLPDARMFVNFLLGRIDL